MSITYSLYEQNVAHFKFLSQHFHKSLVMLEGGAELKGTKAHDRFAKLLGWPDLNKAYEYLKGHNKRIRDFRKLSKDAIESEYSDLYPNISAQSLLSIYYNFSFFALYRQNNVPLILESIKHLKSLTFFPKKPTWNMGEVADFLAVGLEDLSFLLDADQRRVSRELICSAIMIYFDFYDKGLIDDFRWQDIADITHPHCYHDAFIKYKTQLNPKYNFESAAIHCYDKFTYFVDVDQQVFAHNKLCEFLSKINRSKIVALGKKKDILFNRVYENTVKSGTILAIDAPNSFELHRDRVFTLDDFDFSHAEFVEMGCGSDDGDNENEL